jgi:hypothetical protein
MRVKQKSPAELLHKILENWEQLSPEEALITRKGTLSERLQLSLEEERLLHEYETALQMGAGALLMEDKGLPAGFFLDFCLPPDGPEVTWVGLQDVYERLWLKRYPRPVARALCYVHVISTILSHHSSKISKLIGVVLGFLGFKKFTGWFSGS